MSKLTSLIAFIFLAVSSAWAQTPAPTTPAPGATPGGAPAGDAAAAGGIGDYWWLIVLVIIAAVAIWYFTRSRSRNRV
jgi:uncharacterized protein HemX